METTGPADGTLADLLKERAAAKFSGALQVDGQPGGIIYFTAGRISGCETSGAPSLEVILLRSQRVSVSDWEAAFTAAAVSRRQMTVELVERELLGAGETEALLRTALADAMFALVSGQFDGWAEAPAAECRLPLTPAVGSGWLLNEATRRRQVLASFPVPTARAHDRIAAVPASARGMVGQGQDKILALVDGRRTARDLAFALGRGLFETMLQLARMQAANVVLISSPGQEPGKRADAVPDGKESDRTVTGLPRRRKDGPSPPRSGESGRRNFVASIQMLLPRSDGNKLPDGALRQKIRQIAVRSEYRQWAGSRGRPKLSHDLQGGKAQVVEDALLAEMRALQEKVAGITGTAVASRDGLIVREDTGGIDPDNLTALAAAWLALAQGMSSEAGQGTLREAMTRSSGGSVTIYAIGAQAVLVIIGDEGLDTSKLHRESQSALDAIKTLMAANSSSAKASLGERKGDGVQCQAHAGTYDRPVDADELQVPPEEQF